ncbi:hypothetical protein AMYX_24230 [Anaeromyxobacter diazotrophicus]|uniref:Polymer-forming cytoskeletal protein n=2 Tax=Anaeromyxobacter diazotrophicus TaxID=2590199 RepID=A0A7I9VMQ6_9BACT|nr:hypothetical protein AMYX_24230 [Anaeromyxobacter diazotrophicus]
MPFWNKPREDGPSPAHGPAERAEPVTLSPHREEPQPMAMLKREDVTSTPAASSDLNALLGRGSEFEGKLTFEGTVRIDGKFTGTIVTGDVLVVGEGAKISAEISCGTIIIHGEVTGNVRAKNAVELHHPAKMRGNVETPSLMVEKGVIFEGQTKMENLSADRKPAATPIAAVKG